MKKSRSQIFKELDVEPTNSRWAWCAKNERFRIAVFTIWEDEELDNSTWVLHNEKETYRKNGYFDQKRVLDSCIKNNYEVYGLVAEAEDPSQSPRSIRSINEHHLIKLSLKKQGDKIFGQKKCEVSFLDFISKNRNRLSEDGLSDLLSSPNGKLIPDRALIKGITFKRDTKVRAYVLKRANGACEYCGESPFELKNGEPFLETHHIIALASDGEDTVRNVIALCPNHHREAHYGKNAVELEKGFIEIVQKKIN